MKNVKNTFQWVVNLLRDRHIPFEVFGGFAANLYGSKRALADIDIAVLDVDVLRIAKLVRKYVVFGPQRYHDKNWDIILTTIHYHGQEIDIVGISSAKIFDSRLKKWTTLKFLIPKATHKKVYELCIPVIPLKKLIAYKKKLNRRVDRADVGALTSKQYQV